MEDISMEDFQDSSSRDVETALPLPSIGSQRPEERKRSRPYKPRDRPKYKKQATISSGNRGRRKPPPPPPDNTKKCALIAGLILCLVSLIAIILVISGNFGPTYNTSMPQFMGELQMEEINNEFMIWRDEYSDPKAEVTQQLTSSLLHSLRRSFQEEGVSVDDISVTSLAPSTPKTVTKSRLTSPGPQNYMAHQPFTPAQLASMQYESQTFPNTKFVKVTYETKGKPSRNAATFAAAHGKWPRMANMLESRLQSDGYTTVVEDLHPFDVFMDEVFDVVGKKPDLVTPPPTHSPAAEPCDCTITGAHIAGHRKICSCSSGCVLPTTFVYGGYNNKFAQYTSICLAAYYAGVISESGGTAEALNLRYGSVKKGPVQKGINPHAVEFDINVFKIKSVGPAIRALNTPTLPPETGGQVVAPGASFDSTFTVYIQYRKIDGQPVSYAGTMTNVQSTEAQAISSKIQPKITTATTGQGFDVSGVTILHFINPPSKVGVIVGMAVNGDNDKNAKVALRLEKMEPGGLPQKITTGEDGDDYTVRSFRYGKNILEKMSKIDGESS